MALIPESGSVMEISLYSSSCPLVFSKATEAPLISPPVTAIMGVFSLSWAEKEPSLKEFASLQNALGRGQVSRSCLGVAGGWVTGDKLFRELEK